MEYTRLEIMVDLETLGTSINSTVFQIGAICFDIKTGKIIDTFNKVCDIELDELNIDGSTLKWWLTTNKELMFDLLVNQGKCTQREMWQDFNRFLHLQQTKCFDLHLWGNGILFDNAMVRNNMEKHINIYPIKYNKDRDVRTILELASAKSGLSEKQIKERNKSESEIEHDALDDCKFQIRYVCDCWNILTK